MQILRNWLTHQALETLLQKLWELWVLDQLLCYEDNTSPP